MSEISQTDLGLAKRRRRSSHARKVTKKASTKNSSAVKQLDTAEHNQALARLLAEPEIRAVMHADRVDVANLLAELNALSSALRSGSRSSPLGDDKGQKSNPPDADYRPGVGIMLVNRQGLIFIGRRVDIHRDAWQMPQGGINAGESPLEAAKRELREEVGTDDVDVIAESNGWFYYYLPKRMIPSPGHEHGEGNAKSGS